MKKLYLVTSFSMILITLSSCDWFTAPEELEPGRRDYVWTEDTITVPPGYYTSLGYMWGSSPNDIWACGDAYVSDNTIWHWNGISWEPYDVDRFCAPTGIYGFSSNDIWFCTTNGEYWHYNGTEWSMHTKLFVEGYDLINQRMYGRAPNDIYAVGFADSPDDYYGLIVHYDGSEWEVVDIPKIKTCFQRFRYDKTQKKYIISSTGFDAGPRERLFEFDGTELTEIHLGDEGTNIGYIKDKIYVQIGSKIYKFNNSELELFQDFTFTNYCGNIYGRNEKDFFTTNYDGIGHFNGTELATIYETDQRVIAMQIFDNEVFFLGVGNYKTVIIHGKLSQ